MDKLYIVTVHWLLPAPEKNDGRVLGMGSFPTFNACNALVVSAIILPTVHGV